MRPTQEHQEGEGSDPRRLTITEVFLGYFLLSALLSGSRPGDPDRLCWASHGRGAGLIGDGEGAGRCMMDSWN